MQYRDGTVDFDDHEEYMGATLGHFTIFGPLFIGYFAEVDGES